MGRAVTHSDNCWKWHKACFHRRVAAQLEEHRDAHREGNTPEMDRTCDELVDWLWERFEELIRQSEKYEDDLQEHLEKTAVVTMTPNEADDVIDRRFKALEARLDKVEMHTTPVGRVGKTLDQMRGEKP